MYPDVTREMVFETISTQLMLKKTETTKHDGVHGAIFLYSFISRLNTQEQL